MQSCGIAGLAYVVIESANLDAWERFGTSVLGAQASRRDGELTFRMDERLARIVVRPGSRDAVTAMAWEVTGRDRWDDVLARVRKFGMDVEVFDGPKAEENSVHRLARCVDPAGNKLEFVLAPFVEPVRQFVSPTGVSFVTGDQGMGHATIFVENYEDTVRFYTEGLGFQVRDMIDGGLRATFAGCNPRHHAIALVGWQDTHLDHIMVEVSDINMVGRALDKVIAGEAPLTQGLGRHWNDHMISFYMQSPSGFQIEYGCWARQVDPRDWVEVRQGGVGGGSIWGHKPTSLAPDLGAHE